MELSYSELSFPEIKNKLSGEEYRTLKGSIVSLILGQRYKTFEDQSANYAPWEPIKDVDTKLKTVNLDYAKELKELRAGKRKKFTKDVQNKKDMDNILIKNGTLRASFSGGEGTGVEIEEDEITIFTEIKYAAIHNFGGVINHPGTKNGFGRGIKISPHKITIPARPFDEFTEMNEEEIAELIQMYINE